MAADVTKLTYFSAPIVKVEKSADPADDAVYVYGKVTNDELDLDDQIVDRDWARKALGDWFNSFANIRQMHSTNLPPAGKGVELEEKEDGFYIKARIVEPSAKKLAAEGVYSAFSIGVGRPGVVRDAKAKNGRINAGKIVEVSVVDFPALITAKFTVCKLAESGEDAEILEKVSGTDTEARLIDLIEKFGVQHVKLYPEAVFYKREVSDKERARLADEGKALPDGSFPIDNEEDLRNAIQAVGRAKDYAKAKSHIIARAKAMGKTDLLPDDWKSDGEGSKKDDKKTEKIVVPAALVKLHDITCPAYSLADVFEVYPEVAKNGVAVSLGPQALGLVHQMFTSELAEDAGSGKQAYDLKCLAEVYCELQGFVTSELYQVAIEQSEGVLRTVRTELHKAFADANAGAHPIPGVAGAGTPNPGQFRRPELRAGHARSVATGAASAGGGLGHATNVPSPSDFTRGPITAGHERTTPGDATTRAAEPDITKAEGRPSSTASGKELYADMAADQARNGLLVLHDRLIGQFASICPMEKAANQSPDGSPSGGDKLDLRETAQPVAAASSLPSVGSAPGEKGTMAEVMKRAVRDEVETVTAAITAKYESEVKSLREQLDKLGSQPDPAHEPFRGASLRVIEKSSQVNEAQERGELRELNDQIAYFERLEKSSNLDYVKYAQVKLPGLIEKRDALLKKIQTPALAA